MKAAPRRAVTDARVTGGGSIGAPFKFHWWTLRLECGHEVERRIRWLPVANAPRGYAAQHQGVPLDRLPSKPLTALCEECDRS